MTWPQRRLYRAPALELRGRNFAWGARTYVMGIINVTPDSFSGDGLAGDPAAAAALAQRFAAEGADILDIGGESSRPGAAPLAPEEECRRLMPALEAVRAATDLPISVDTYHAPVAEAALAAGADAINDIFGLRNDPAMADVVARRGAALFAMHNQRGRPVFDVIPDISAGWGETLRLAGEAGIPEARIVLDPGFGFGWTPAQNLELLRRLPELHAMRFPLLLGVSRKSTIGAVLDDAPVERRLAGTASATALCVAAGADVVRVHDVAAMRDVVRIADAITRGYA